jgi:hypothetical protein
MAPPCYIKDNLLYPYNEGTCIIEAHTSETTNYEASKSNQIIVNFVKNTQAINIDNMYTIDFKQMKDLSQIGNNLNYSIDVEKTVDVGVIINNFFVSKNSGIATVNATREGNRNYNSYNKTFLIKVNKIKQTIVLNNINLLNSIFVNPDIENSLNISGLEENPEIFYNISDSNICIIKNGKLVAINAGECEIEAYTGETRNYLSTTTNKMKIIVVKNNQIELKISKSGDLFYSSSINLETTGGSTSAPIIYSSFSTNCKLVNNIVIGLQAGPCQINVFKEGNFMYFDTSSNIIININKIYQNMLRILPLNDTNTIYVNPNSTHKLLTSEVKDNASVVYKTINNENNICSINGDELKPNLSGECTVQAISLESINYLETISPPVKIIIIKNEQNQLIIKYKHYEKVFTLQYCCRNTRCVHGSIIFYGT